MFESCELWKTKRTRAHIYKHRCINTHIHAHTHTHTHTRKRKHTYTHARKDTRMHASVRSRASTHTKCSFVIGCQSLWNHLPDNVKEAGSIEFFKQILKTVVFSQYFKIPYFFKFVTVPSTLFYLIVVKEMIINVQSHRTTSVSTCAIYETLWEVENSRLITWVIIRRVLTLREVE